MWHVFVKNLVVEELDLGEILKSLSGRNGDIHPTTR